MCLLGEGASGGLAGSAFSFRPGDPEDSCRGSGCERTNSYWHQCNWGGGPTPSLYHLHLPQLGGESGTHSLLGEQEELPLSHSATVWVRPIYFVLWGRASTMHKLGIEPGSPVIKLNALPAKPPGDPSPSRHINRMDWLQSRHINRMNWLHERILLFCSSLYTQPIIIT